MYLWEIRNKILDKKIRRGVDRVRKLYTDEDIDWFLKSIKYFDKIKFDRDCRYEVFFDRGDEYIPISFDNIYDAIRSIFAFKKEIYRHCSIEINIEFVDNRPAINFEKFANKDFFEIKDETVEFARSASICFDKDMTQVYYIKYYERNDTGGSEIGWDMKFLYDKDKCIIPTPYTAYDTDLNIGYSSKYSWKKKEYNVRVPWFIEGVEDIGDGIFTVARWGSCFYGFKGCYQVTHGDGCVDTDDTLQPDAMPLASVRIKDSDRPYIKGITRYKFIIKFPDGRVYPHYVECETGNMNKAIEMITWYDWTYDEINENPKDYIESISAVPEGEWF